MVWLCHTMHEHNAWLLAVFLSFAAESLYHMTHEHSVLLLSLVLCHRIGMPYDARAQCILATIVFLSCATELLCRTTHERPQLILRLTIPWGVPPGHVHEEVKVRRWDSGRWLGAGGGGGGGSRHIPRWYAQLRLFLYASAFSLRERGRPTFQTASVSCFYVSMCCSEHVGRAPESWLKGCEFESRQEQQENFLLQR